MNTTTFRIELDVAAEKIIHQFMTGNERIENDLSIAIKKSVENFDFEKAVDAQVHKTLTDAIAESFKYGKLRELVQKKADSIIDKLIEVEFKKFDSIQ